MNGGHVLDAFCTVYRDHIDPQIRALAGEAHRLYLAGGFFAETVDKEMMSR